MEDSIKADAISFRMDKYKGIKKEEKKLSERDKLKEKMKRMNPQFSNQLRAEIKHMNKPTSSIFLKK